MIKKYVPHLLIFVLFLGCREAIEPDSIEFLDVLVVESTITNELKHQEVKLSRTYRIDSDEPIIENNATVWIQDSQNNSYSFTQNNEGIYLSNVPFQAMENMSYTLFITTQDGKQYHSEVVNLTAVSEITNLYAELESNNQNEDGIQVFIDSDNSSGFAEYFRYEYEETYKVIAPNYFTADLNLTNFRNVPGSIHYDREITLREQEERVCYTTKKSEGIIQTSTTELDENTLVRFPIRFIPIDDAAIRERYSILVRQYVQSLEAYTFYKTVDDLGIVGSVLSQVQPGYVLGNIISENESEKVVGYFEASTVSSERIYFDYTDFNIILPAYFYNCNVIILDYLDNTALDDDPNERALLYQFITVDNYKLYSDPGQGTIYEITNPECGDCTSISSNIRPEFWED